MRNKPYPWNERLPWLSDFPEFLAFIEQSYATKPAFVYERGKESVTVTFAQFVADVYNLAAELHLRNWAGKHYALMGPTSYEWILFFFAGILSGGLAVAVDKDLPVKELQLRLTLSDTDILVYVSAYADIANSLHCKDKLCFDETAKLLDHGAAIFSRGGIDRKALVPGVDAPAAIFFTSGTTGRAKGVMLSSRNIIFNVCAASRSFWEEGMNLLILPLHHIYGIAAALLSPLLGGSCSAICPSVKRVKYFLTAYPPDCIFGVPMVVESIAAELWRAAAKQKKTKLLKTMLAISNGLQKIGIDASSILLASVRKNFGGRLQSIGCGGAELDVKYYSLFRGLGVSLVNGYGITECAPMIAMNRNRHWRDGSVGLPLC
ncbi:MAG: AMP-binding protein, partial [Oscillospiraceae bacterium]|nr:AMP-binding protein [Oscillospiraceae bacterium]